MLSVEEEEDHLQQSQNHEVQLCQTLRLQVEDLQKRLEEKDNKLTQANKVIRALRDEVKTLQQQLEQHRRKYRDDVIGQTDHQCRCGREDGITLTRTVLSGSRPSEPEPCSSDAGTTPKHQDITSQDVATQHFPPFSPEGSGIPPNIFLSCTTEDDPEDVPLSPQEVEDDPAGVPMSPGDDTLTSSEEEEDEPADMPLILGDSTLIRGKSPRQLKRPVLSVKLQDCREMLGADGVLKMESDDDDEDEDDFLCYEDDDDDSDYDPKSDGCSRDKEMSTPEEGIAEPEGEQRRQSRGGKRMKAKTALAKSHEYRERGKTCSFSSQKLSVHQRGNASIKPVTTATPCDNISTESSHENTSIDYPHEKTSTDSPITESHQEVGGEHRANATPESCNENQTVHTGERHQANSSERPYACKHCDAAFTQSSGLIHHEKVHSLKKKRNRRMYDVPSECDVCGLMLTNKRNLIVHKRRHTGEKPYACTQCGNTFRSSSALRGHQKFHNHLQEKPSGTEKTEEYQCDVCGKILSNRYRLREHSRVHTGERPYACTQCDKTFKHRVSFVSHQNIHKGEKPYACAQCGMAFSSPSNLRAHQKKHHTQERPSDAKKRKNFECDVCGKILATNSSLHNHLRLHTGDRPYACTQCDKTFKQQTALSMHKRIHTGEKPHPCTRCEKTFRTSSSLRAHQERHHAQNTGGVPNMKSNKAACDVCGKILQKQSLYAHKRLHTGTGYQCDVCGMIIIKQSSLLKHQLIHTGEKPYACTLCEKTFRYKATLERHGRHHVYATEGPYKCSDCHMEFKTPGYLKRHVRRKHTAK